MITASDRTLIVPPGQTVMTAWIDIDVCVLGCRVLMAPEAVEKRFRVLLNLGECAEWPPIVGHWRCDGRFAVDDGRHTYLASLMIGRRDLFVCWLSGMPETLPEIGPEVIIPI